MTMMSMTGTIIVSAVVIVESRTNVFSGERTLNKKKLNTVHWPWHIAIVLFQLPANARHSLPAPPLGTTILIITFNSSKI